VLARRKVLPYARAKLAELPNLLSLLQLARALGYPVRGRKLLDPLI
jgi:hypothetical protein